MYGGRVAPCFAHGHAGIKPVTFPVLVVVSLTGTLSPTSLISSLQKCLKRIREYFIYIFMQRADLWLERLYMWWIVEGFVRIRHFSGTHFHLRSRLFGRREDGFIFKFNVWLYGCNTYLHYLPFALYDEGKLFFKKHNSHRESKVAWLPRWCIQTSCFVGSRSLNSADMQFNIL